MNDGPILPRARDVVRHVVAVRGNRLSREDRKHRRQVIDAAVDSRIAAIDRLRGAPIGFLEECVRRLDELEGTTRVG